MDLKSGFWIGMGIMLAFGVITMLQYLVLRTVKRSHGY